MEVYDKKVKRFLILIKLLCISLIVSHNKNFLIDLYSQMTQFKPGTSLNYIL